MSSPDPIPIEHGDPVPGGIRPGPDTNHTPSNEAGSTPQSSGEAPSAADSE
jgi:hypothetical protein